MIFSSAYGWTVSPNCVARNPRTLIRMASDAGNATGLVFFLIDLLHLDGEDLTARPLTDRKVRLAGLLERASSSLHYSDHQTGLGPAFYEKACALAVEGIVSKPRRCRLHARQSRPVAQGQMPQPRGSDRLDRSRRHAAVSRRLAARLLRCQRQAHLCRPRWHWYQYRRA
jgi:hypothetical protein